MRWNDLSNEWKLVFKLSWQSMCEGNLPIAAIITDLEGKVLSTGRNHYYNSPSCLNPKVDHAEVECIRNLDIKNFPHTKEYILYVNMEPCPMCMGAISMGQLRHVRVACRDPWAGATELCRTFPYIQSKNIEIAFMDDIYGELQIAFQGYCELMRASGEEDPVWKAFSKRYPNGAITSKRLYETRALVQCIEQKAEIETAFNLVCTMLEKS